MTFTRYLRHLIVLGLKPSFHELLDHRAWPDGSTRLEDYETFLWHTLHAPRAGALLELQTLWSRWVDGPASSADLHADNALLAWRDYVNHLVTCDVEEGWCSRTEELLDHAIDASHFRPEEWDEDLVPCEPPDEAEARRERDLVAEDVLGLAEVEAILQKHRDRALRSSPSPTTKQ